MGLPWWYWIYDADMCYSKSLLKVHAPSSALNDNALGSDI